MTASHAADGRSDSSFAHTALIVDSDDTLRTRLVPALRRSLRDDQHFLMVVRQHTATVVRDALAEGGDHLEWGDPGAFYQRLGFAYEGFRRYLAEQHAAGRRVHVVAEPDLTDEPNAHGAVDRAAAYLAYESICNQTYAPYGSSVTCLWDSRRHRPAIIDGARSVHNHELAESGPVANPRYVAPEDYLAGRNDNPLPPPPRVIDHDLELAGIGDLGLLRAMLWTWTDDHRFAASAADDITVAATEIATNGLVHGIAPVRIRAWHHGDTLIVQIDDKGGHQLSPTAGYRRPRTDSLEGGRGLWLARQLADTVTVHAEPGRTSIRMHFPHDVTHRTMP
jgi:anti-sigma regulatory factor (Ser/Thr protein kinase)